MTFRQLTPNLVERIHDEVLNTGELAGRAQGKSLEGALARVDNRIAYGMVNDVYDLAAAYGHAIARGHCFNDANKRTAFRTVNAALVFNGVKPDWSKTNIADQIILLAQGILDEEDFAVWLRSQLG